MQVDEFRAKNVFVVGGGRGIGAAVVESFAEQGAKVAVGFHANEAAASTLCTRAGTAGSPMAVAIQVDVTERRSVDAFFESAAAALGAPDIIVIGSGRLRVKPMVEVTEEEWAEAQAVNLTGAFRCLQVGARLMLRHQTRGRLIAFSSMAGKSGGHPFASPYAAAKGGVIALVRSMAVELAANGITVNAVAPALVDTEMLNELPPERKAQIITTVPVGRMGYPREAAHAVLYLASIDAAFVTGETLNVSGGRFMD